MREKQNSVRDSTNVPGNLDHADLPAMREARWGARRKAQVLQAMQAGKLSFDDACERYMLSAEELKSWQEAVGRHGVAGLKVISLGERRQRPRRPVNEPCSARLSATRRMECVMTDVSPSGARIEFAAPVRAPAGFELKCNRTGRCTWAEVRWTRGNAVGVVFRASPAAPSIMPSDVDAWLLGERD